MRAIAGVLAFGLAGVAASAAAAASVTSTVSKEGNTVVSILGEIAEGDADALKLIIKSSNDEGRLVSGVRLNSPGGSLLEGVKLAEIIRYGKIATVVANGAHCASACFLVFAAGSPRFASYSASVGVHGASDEDGEETPEAGAATVSMARIAKNLGVPAPIIGKMVVTPPDQIIWLTPDDLRSMGATMTGKPAQTPQNQPEAQQPPMQLDPTARASVSGGNKAPSWNEFVDGAYAISARQNGGKAEEGRACQPELKICNTAVFFKFKGVDVMVRTSEDADGKTLDRDYCLFNQFGDVRTCTDWDTGATIREMKNQQGTWIKVGDD